MSRFLPKPPSDRFEPVVLSDWDEVLVHVPEVPTEHKPGLRQLLHNTYLWKRDSGDPVSFVCLDLSVIRKMWAGLPHDKADFSTLSQLEDGVWARRPGWSRPLPSKDMFVNQIDRWEAVAAILAEGILAYINGNIDALKEILPRPKIAFYTVLVPGIEDLENGCTFVRYKIS